MTNKFILILSLVITILSSAVFAAEEVHYKIINESDYVEFNTSTKGVQPMLQEIAIQTFRKPFTPSLISPIHYEIKSTDNLVWLGQNITQYEFTPKNSDRFKHIVWVAPDNQTLIKLEIYDNDNNIFFTALCMQDCQKNREYTDKDSKRDNLFYGFTNTHIESEGNTIKMRFSDGLNNFSVFKTDIRGSDSDPDETNNSTEVIIYGNNVYNNSTDQFKFTIVGTIPFDMMKKIYELMANEDIKVEKNRVYKTNKNLDR